MITRRNFLIATGVTALASTRVFGANDTIRLGLIGAGQRMKVLLDAADTLSSYQIVAVSDVYGTAISLRRVLMVRQLPTWNTVKCWRRILTL